MENNCYLGYNEKPSEEEIKNNKELSKAVINGADIIRDIAYVILHPMPIGELRYLDVENIDGKDQEGFNRIGLVPKKFVVHLDPHYTIANRTPELSEDMLKIHGISLDNELKKQLIIEQSRLMVSKVFEKVREIANHNIFDLKDTFWEKIIKFFYNLIGKKYERVFKVDHIRKIVSKILLAGNMIATKDRRGPATFIIVSPGMASLLADSSSYVFRTDAGFITPSSGNQYEKNGTIAGLIVIIDHNMEFNDFTVYVGRKTNEGDPGIYLPIMDDSTSFDEIIEPMKKITQLKVRYNVVATPNCTNKVARLKFKLIKEAKKNWFGK